jgi:dihydroorotase
MPPKAESFQKLGATITITGMSVGIFHAVPASQVWSRPHFGGIISRATSTYRSMLMPKSVPDRLTIRRPDDWHVHLRDGAMLDSVVNHTARQFARAIVMPNLVPPVTTVAAAQAYKTRIMAALDPALHFTPLMTCYLTDDADPVEIERGFTEGVFTACKLYPANATTNSSHGVTDVANIAKVLATMERIGMPLLVHGEVTDPEIDIFDREAVFIERILRGLIKDFPGLKIVFEHITTADAVDFVDQAGSKLAATITPHHLDFNRNAIFVGGIRPHFYCLPVAKREVHRIALRKAATSGSPKFFLGTDSAPHPVGDKESACGCAGIFNAPFAMESYARTFAAENALDRLEGFASEHGPRFYGLPLNEGTITLEHAPASVPETIPAGETTLVPFHAGESLPWRVAELSPAA